MNYAQAFAGGLLIGLASWLLLAGLGRVSGISGILSESLTLKRAGAEWRWLFLVGLIGGGALFAGLSGPVAALSRPAWLLIGAGLLVGFGTVLGSGCTSGHGVCGLGRRSLRSLVAVCVFMATGGVMVWLTQHVLK